jgi:hypothetical protein
MIHTMIELIIYKEKREDKKYSLSYRSKCQTLQTRHKSNYCVCVQILKETMLRKVKEAKVAVFHRKENFNK